MIKRLSISFAVAAAFSIPAGGALAVDETPVKESVRTQEMESAQERIYGSQLMTQQERNEYRARMRAAKTAEEREQIRNEHHERMKERAKERGVTLPDEPPAGGGRMRSGGGMGPGDGMGPGGRNR